MPLSHSKTDPRGAKKKSHRAKGGKTKQGGRPPRGPGGKPRKELPYFLRPVTGGGIGVFRRPVGNRAEATNCGVMPSRKLADALVAQLKRAESVVSDLFLEATEDGIEALEAVLAACRDAVVKQADGRPRREARGPRPEQGDAAAEGGERGERGERAGGRKPRRGRGRRRGRGPRGGDSGAPSEPAGGA